MYCISIKNLAKLLKISTAKTRLLLDCSDCERNPMMYKSPIYCSEVNKVKLMKTLWRLRMSERYGAKYLEALQILKCQRWDYADH